MDFEKNSKRRQSPPFRFNFLYFETISFWVHCESGGILIYFFIVNYLVPTW